MAKAAVLFNHFPALARKLKPALQAGIKNTAGAVKLNAQGQAPILTGFMMSNVYTAFWDGSSYAQGIAPPVPSAFLLPEERPKNDLTAIVGAAANYSLFVEMGTRRMAARPWFLSAVEQARPEFAREMADALRKGLSI